ncbi:uncharacterized protein LOC118423839 [Branchiostoma floridae]|uniref:Uncharacterized protein LOC118423839 n=1 Tax=Branchiostoma floridae TaxID=7739 RepID=A0A9J7LRJ3_BRAFL|nr:uncharacterized protein LOC118423839 [Branchiostoma floridae]
MDAEAVTAAIELNKQSILNAVSVMMDQKLGDLKRANEDLAEKQVQQLKKMKSDSAPKIKRKAYQDQFDFTQQVKEKLVEAKTEAQAGKTERALQALAEGEELISFRQKCILMADKSEAGWLTVEEYKKNELADNSDDEKRMFKAEMRAKKAKKENEEKRRKTGQAKRSFDKSFQPPVRFYGNATSSVTSAKKPGNCFACGEEGHWRGTCPKLSGFRQRGQQFDTMSSKKL